MLDPEVEARPWEQQVALDDERYRAQLAYLLERSPFYREKLSAAGLGSAEEAGGGGARPRPPRTPTPEGPAAGTAA